MPKKEMKSNLGVTLMSLVVTIIILLLITGTIIYNSRNSILIKKYDNLYSDIETIQYKVNVYYSSYGEIPVLCEYLNQEDLINLIKSNATANGATLINSEDIVNANDDETYYVIDLEKLDGLTLNYGYDDDYEAIKSNATYSSSSIEDSIYIVNNLTHQIYYPNGIFVDGVMYYTNNAEDFSNKFVSSLDSDKQDTNTTNTTDNNTTDTNTTNTTNTTDNNTTNTNTTNTTDNNTTNTNTNTTNTTDNNTTNTNTNTTDPGTTDPTDPEVEISGNITHTITWNEGDDPDTATAELSLEKDTDEYSIVYSTDGNNWHSYTEELTVTNGTTIYVCLTDGTNYGETYEIEVLDKTAPKVEVEAEIIEAYSITVTVTATDEGAGMLDNATYNYYIKTSDEEEFVLKGENIQDVTYEFTDLTPNTKYDIKVTTTDKIGNKGEGTTDEVTLVDETQDDYLLDETPESVISWSPTTWTNGSVVFTTDFESDFITLVYEINGEKYEFDGTFEVEENCTITFYYEKEGVATGPSFEVVVDWIDKDLPTIDDISEGSEITEITITMSDATSTVEKIALIELNDYEPSASKFYDLDYYGTVTELSEHEVQLNITDLELNNAYFIWCMDSAGNKSSTYTLYCTADVTMTESIVLSEYDAVAHSIYATLPINAVSTITTQYQILKDGEELSDSGWVTYSGSSIEIDSNCTIYYRYNFLNFVFGDYKVEEITNIDLDAPVIKQIGASPNSATVTLDDGEDGSGVVQYAILSLPLAYTSVPSSSWKDYDGEKITYNFSSSATSYYIYAIDAVGNCSQSTIYKGEGITITASNKKTTSATFTGTPNTDISEDITIGTEIYWCVYGVDEELTDDMYEETSSTVYNFTDGEDYGKYNVAVYDNNGNFGSISSYQLDKADTKAPTVTKTTTQYWENNEYETAEITIADSGTNASGIMSYKIYDENGEVITDIEGNELEGTFSDSSNTTITFDVELPCTTTIYVYAEDWKENSSTTTLVFDGDTGKPTVTLSSTPTPSIVDGVPTLTYTVTIEDTKSGIKEYSIEIDDKEFDTSELTLTTDTDYKKVFSLSIPNYSKLYIKATDNVGNVYEYSKTCTFSEKPSVTLSSATSYEVSSGKNLIYATVTAKAKSYLGITYLSVSGLADELSLSYSESECSVEYTEESDGTITAILKFSEEQSSCSFTVAVENKNTLSVTAYNSFGYIPSNESYGFDSNYSYTNKNTYKDTTAPTVDHDCDYYVEDDTNMIDVTFTLSDTASGLDYYCIKVDGVTEEEGEYGGVTGEKTISITIKNNQTVSYEVKDLFGNSTGTVTIDISDNDGPQVEYEILSCIVKDGKNLVKVNATITDDESGIVSYTISGAYVYDSDPNQTYELDEPSSSETVTLYVENGDTLIISGTDLFGNYSTNSQYFGDYKAPTYETTISSYTVEDGVNMLNCVITFTDKSNSGNNVVSGVKYYKVVDNDTGSVLAEKTLSSVQESVDVSFSIENKENSNIYFYVEDLFGNYNSNIITNLNDFTGPTATITATSSSSSGYYLDSNGNKIIKVKVTIADSGSGVVSYSISGTISGDGDYTCTATDKVTQTCEIYDGDTITIVATDLFGNTSTTNKTFSASATPTIKNTKNTYYVEGSENKVTATITIACGESGVGVYRIDVLDSEGNTIQEGEEVNGNGASSVTESITINNGEQIYVVANSVFGEKKTATFDPSDTTAPTVKIEQYSYNVDENDRHMITLKITVSDELSGLNYYYFSGDSEETEDNIGAGAGKEKVIYIDIEDGGTLTYEVTDLFGNTSGTIEKTINSEAKIEIEFGEQYGYRVNEGTNLLSVDYTITDTALGIDYYEITVGENTTKIEVGTSADITESIEVENGTKITIYAVNLFGYEFSASTTLQDKTGPTIKELNATYNSETEKIRVQVEITDEQSGIGEYTIIYGDNTISGNGDGKTTTTISVDVDLRAGIQVDAKDIFGNEATTLTKSYIDDTAPTISYSIESYYVEDNTNLINVTVTIKDSGYGLKSYSISGVQDDDGTVSSDELKGATSQTKTVKVLNEDTISVEAEDVFGNKASTTIYVSDVNGPTISGPTKTYYVEDEKNMVSCYFIITDSESGVSVNGVTVDGASISSSSSTEISSGKIGITVIVENGTTFYITAKDKFGNSSETKEVDIDESDDNWSDEDDDSGGSSSGGGSSGDEGDSGDTGSGDVTTVPDPETGYVSPSTWTTEAVELVLTETDGYTLQYKIDDGNWTIYKSGTKIDSNCTITYRLIDDDENTSTEKTLVVSNIDLEEPTAEIQSDNLTGITLLFKDDASGVKYYAIMDSEDEPTDEDWIYIGMGEGLTETTVTIDTLEIGTVYYVYVTDYAGRISDPLEISPLLRTINGEVTCDPTFLTSGDVTVTLPTYDSLTTKYIIVTEDEVETYEVGEDSDWIEYTEALTITENCYIYYCYEYEDEVSEYYSYHVTNIDKDAPVVNFAMLIDGVLNVEFEEANTTMGYLVSEIEYVDDNDININDFVYWEISSSDEQYYQIDWSTLGLEVNGIDDVFYVYLIDESGNISAPVSIGMVILYPGELVNGYTNQDEFEFSLGDWTNCKVYVESLSDNYEGTLDLNGDVWTIDILDTWSDCYTYDYFSGWVDESCNIYFKIVNDDGLESRQYTIAIDNIDTDGPTIEISDWTVEGANIKVTDDGVGIEYIEVYDYYYDESYMDVDYSDNDIYVSEIPTTWLDLKAGSDYIEIYTYDYFGNETYYEFDTLIPAPGEATITPTDVTSGTVTVEFPEYNLTTESGEFTIYYQVSGDDSYEGNTVVVDENCSIDYWYVYTNADGEEFEGEISTIEITNIDKAPPTNSILSVNSYSVLIEAVESDSYDSKDYAMAGVQGYYLSKEDTAPESSEDFTDFDEEDYVDDNTVQAVIKNLDVDETYYLWTIDKVGNISEVISFETKIEVASGASIAPATWTADPVTVTLPTQELLITEYIILGEDTDIETETWTEYSSEFEVSENCVILYRYADEVAKGNYATLNVDNIDTEIPTFSVTYLSMDNTLKLSASDGDGSGIGGYSVTTSADETEETTVSDEDETIEITDLDENTEYYVKVLDSVGNISEALKIKTGRYYPSPTTYIQEGEAVSIILPEIEGYNTEYSIDSADETDFEVYTEELALYENVTVYYRYVNENDETDVSSVYSFTIGNILDEDTMFELQGYNPPALSDGMIPIKYDGENWVVCDKYDSEWYNYVDQAEGEDGSSYWANVMLSDGTYDSETVEVGTVVAEEDLGSMFVWIPRYAYAITSGYASSTAGTIEIAFLQGTKTYSVGDTVKYSTNGVEGEAVLANESGSGNWNEHPAFTFGDETVSRNMDCKIPGKHG